MCVGSGRARSIRKMGVHTSQYKGRDDPNIALYSNYLLDSHKNRVQWPSILVTIKSAAILTTLVGVLISITWMI